ncbi:MAG: hypothetical protein H7837_13040 [Magnetococcus sp. MYC-9]
MSLLLIKQIASPDGRLGERSALVSQPHDQPAEGDHAAAQEDFFGHFFSTPRMAQIRRRNQLLREANDAVSLIQVADDALDTTTTALGRMRLLATPALPDARQLLAERLVEQLALTEEIWSIAQRTVYAEQPLLSGRLDHKVFVVGEEPEDLIPITIDDIGGMALDLQRQIGLAVSRESLIGAQAVADSQLAFIDQMLGTVTHLRTTLDGLQSRFSDAMARLQRSTDETLQARKRISDIGIAMEISTLTRDTLRGQPTESVSVQANQQPQLTLRLLQ